MTFQGSQSENFQQLLQQQQPLDGNGDEVNEGNEGSDGDEVNEGNEGSDEDEVNEGNKGSDGDEVNERDEGRGRS
ncbi:hypothetical protein WN944_019309 [Citrus x changshan-huyou]|uniref:Uncharacterized protein n=1 Tax=Citrus x changshan-huyou TaxID=2935761 RepID=A0AAP0QF07_9ROSI